MLPHQLGDGLYKLMPAYDLTIAGLVFRLESPIPLDLHPHYLPFLTHENTNPDVLIRVCVDAPSFPDCAPVFNDGRLVVYPAEAGWFREHRIWSPAEKDRQNPCLVPEQSGALRLCVPRERLAFLADRCEFLWLLAPEAQLALRQRLLLHASSVLLDGRAYLFFGPAGIGKSTHAELWTQAFGAAPLNGDRTVLEHMPAGFVAHGSPFCGSSGICVQASAPLGGLCALAQGPENRIERLAPAEAFRLLYAQTVLNSWDVRQINVLCGMLTALVSLPVYRLTCLPAPSAAVLCRNTLQS